MQHKHMEELGLKNEAGLRFARNVRMQGVRPELVLALVVIADLAHLVGTVLVVSAICNGEHMRNSLHYVGAAVDFMTGLDVGRAEWVEELRSRLGHEYDVIDEGTHIHVEYQSHNGATIEEYIS